MLWEIGHTSHSNRKLLCRSQKHRLVGPCCYFKAGMSNSFYIMDHIQPSLSLEKGSPPNYTFSSRDIWIWEKRCKKSISYPTHERNAAVVNQRLTTGTFMLLNCSSNNTNNHERGFYCCEKLQTCEYMINCLICSYFSEEFNLAQRLVKHEQLASCFLQFVLNARHTTC